MPSTTRTARRQAAAFQARRLAEAEAASDAARIGAMARQRQAAAEVAELGADLAAAGVTLTAEAAAEVAAAEAEAGKRRNAPIRPADRIRIPGRDLTGLSAQAARRALAIERRAGWRITTEAARELAPDLAAEVATLATAEARRADARRWYLAPHGTPRADALRRLMLTGAELGPRWDAAPRPAAAKLAAAWDAADGDRGRWSVSLLAEARRIARRYRTEAEHGAIRQDATEARQARTTDLITEALATAEALAATLADTGAPLTPREQRGVALAVSTVPRGTRGAVGVTSREWAQARGTTPGAERKAAERALADLAERWPNRAALAADMLAAKRGRQAAANDAAADRVIAEALAIGWPASVADLALADAARVRRASDYLAAAARMPAARPARRACYRYAPRADRRTVAERLRQSAAAEAPTRAAAILAWLTAAEHLAETAEHLAERTERRTVRALRWQYATRATLPRPAIGPAAGPLALRATRDAAPVDSVPNDLAAATARALADSTERYSETRAYVDAAMRRRAAEADAA